MEIELPRTTLLVNRVKLHLYVLGIVLFSLRSDNSVCAGLHRFQHYKISFS